MSFALWLEKRGKSPKTISLYTRIAARIAAEGDNPAEWVERNITRETPAGTAHSYFAAALLYWQYRPQGARPVRPPSRKEEKLIEALTPTETKAFLAQLHGPFVPPWIRDFFLLLAGTGLRVAEACSLTGNSVTTISGVEGLRVVGKGNKIRFIPMTPQVKEIVGRRMSLKDKDTPLFLRPSGPLTPDILRKHWRVIRVNLGPPSSKVHPHKLRHTFITRLLAAGADLGQAQKLAGHRSIVTTQRYIHASPERLANAMEKFVQADLRTKDE